MKKIPDFICSSIAVNVEIQIPPEPLQVYNSSGVKVDIPIPSSHIPVNSMQVRLLSSSRRKGMVSFTLSSFFLRFVSNLLFWVL